MRIRRGLCVGVTLLLAMTFGGEAAAQCVGGGPFIGPGPNTCTISAGAGNSHVSGQAAMLDVGSQFMQRFNALFSFRTGASPANNPQGGGADATGAEQRYRTWLEGYGQHSRTDAQGSNFPGDRRRTLGGVAGAGVALAPGLTVGISLDQSQTNIDITGAAQSGRIDLTQIGAIASYENGPWNLGTSLIGGFGRVHTSRLDVGGESTAAYSATLWGAMAELSYLWSLPNNWRRGPKLTFDWMRTRTDPFTETGGATPIAASSVRATRIRMLIGGEVGHSWLLDNKIMDFSVYARLVDNLTQNFGTLQVTDPSGTALSSAANPVLESELGADAGAALSAKLSETLRLYAIYDGRFRGNFTSHAGTFGAEFRF